MNIHSIGIHIKTRNFQKSRAFYQNLGFKKVFEYGPDKAVQEDYSGVVFEHANCKLELADGHRAVKPTVFEEIVPSSKISLMINVKSLNTIVKLCAKHSIPLAVRPRHYYWGTLELVIKDPDGVVLVFIAPYSSSQARLIQADEIWATKPTS